MDVAESIIKNQVQVKCSAVINTEKQEQIAAKESLVLALNESKQVSAEYRDKSEEAMKKSKEATIKYLKVFNELQIIRVNYSHAQVELMNTQGPLGIRQSLEKLESTKVKKFSRKER